MRQVILLLTVIGTGLALEKQIGLEDIERDNLLSEKRTKQQHRQPAIHTQPFIPSQPIPEQHHSQPQPHILLQPQYLLAQPQSQYVSNQFQYLPQQQPRQRFVYVQSSQPKQSQQQQQQQQYLMLLGPNVEYYKNPHVQTGISEDPHNSPHTHNLIGLLQRTAYTNTVPNNYRPQAPQPQQQRPPQPTPHQLYSFRPGPGAPPPAPLFMQPFIIPGITYAQPRQESADSQQGQQTVAAAAYVPARQPTSLLDSYVPSVLQLQYHRQLQQTQPSNYIFTFQAPEHIPRKIDHQ